MTIRATIACCSLVRLFIQPTTAFWVPKLTFLAIILFVEELLDCVLDNVIIDIDVLFGLALICQTTFLVLQVVGIK